MSTGAHARDIKAELAEKKAHHAELEKQTKAIGSEVDKLKYSLSSNVKSLRQTEDNLAAINRRLQVLNQKKLTYSQKLYKNQSDLGGMVAAARQYKTTSTPTLLLTRRPIDAARAATVMKSIIPSLDARSKIIRTEINEIAHIEAAIQEQLESQSKEASALNAQQTSLNALLKDRQNIYAQKESERKAEEEAVKKLAQAAKNLEDLVAKIQPRTKSSSHYRLPSNMILPVRGKIHTGFGEKDDLGAPSKGVTFSSSSGATVVTPLSGKVKFAGAFQKYKQILIIEHQGGYHSLIAGLGRVNTVVGASLVAGEPVGSAETAEDDNLIYFELRQNGTPIDPQKTLTAQRKQEKS